jgi:hypothetical protein
MAKDGGILQGAHRVGHSGAASPANLHANILDEVAQRAEAMRAAEERPVER